MYAHICRIQIWPSLARTYLEPETWWITRPHAQLSSATQADLHRTWKPAKIILGTIIRVCSYWPQSYRVTESKIYRHPRVPSTPVGEILLCLISINSPTCFARRGIINTRKKEHIIVWDIFAKKSCL